MVRTLAAGIKTYGGLTQEQEFARSGRIYAAVGAIIVAWAQAEREMERVIRALAAEEDEETWFHDPEDEYDKMKRCLRILFRAHASDQQVRDLEGNLGLMDEAKVIRNNLAHNWLFHPDPDSDGDPNIVEIYKYWKQKDFEKARTSRQKQRAIERKENRIKYSTQQLLEAHAKLREAGRDIGSLGMQVWGAMVMKAEAGRDNS